jgi:HpcH/HpaI aldolase/citrate lyase family
VRVRIGLQHYPTTNATERLLWFGIGSPLPPDLYETIMDYSPVRCTSCTHADTGREMNEGSPVTLPKLQKSLLSLKSWLFTPATKSDRFARAGDAHADVLIIDLEDSVAPSAKKAARETALLI